MCKIFKAIYKFLDSNIKEGLSKVLADNNIVHLCIFSAFIFIHIILIFLYTLFFNHFADW